jgi:hypothetical protein
MKERNESAEGDGHSPNVPPRVALRSNPAQWADDELLTLVEAASLCWPAGPLTTTSLRNAIRRGQLAYVAIAGNSLRPRRPICREGLADLARIAPLAARARATRESMKRSAPKDLLRPPDTELRLRLRDLANERRRFGYRRPSCCASRANHRASTASTGSIGRKALPCASGALDAAP